MNQNFYNSNSSGFDQIQPPQFPIIHRPPHETSTEILQAREDLMETIRTFLKKFDHIPPGEKCMALLLAEERFLKIKRAFEEENQPEDIQELMLKLLSDLKICEGIQPKQAEQEEQAAKSFTPYGNFSMIDNMKVLKEIQTFLRKFSRISFGVTPKVLSIAWVRISEIDHAFTDKQYQQEDIQELMSKLLEDVRNIKEELSEYINSPSWDRPTFFDYDDDEYTVIWRKPEAITPDLPTEEPEDSLIMGDEHLSTIPKTKESSVENLVPIPSESEDFPIMEVIVIDDESLSDEDVPMEDFKIYSNPLFEDEEIIPTKIDPHSFNAKSNLIKSLLNLDTLIDSSPKFDYLLEELSDPIPPGIEKADFDLEEEILSLSPPLIPVEDSDSHIEEIDLFLASDDLMPPGIEDYDYDSEGDIRFLEELLSNNSLPLPENESSNFDLYDVLLSPRPPLEPPDVEICLNFEPDMTM
ncbi:hypothetical protein Tco_0405553 [Tanacetum coccineum]